MIDFDEYIRQGELQKSERKVTHGKQPSAYKL